MRTFELNDHHLHSSFNGFRWKIDTPLCLRKSGFFVVFSISVSTPTVKRICCLKLCLHLNKQFLTPAPPPSTTCTSTHFLSISITTHIWNWRSDNFTIEIKFTIHLHTSIFHSELATTFVEAAPAPEAWLEEEVVHLLTESYHWKHWAATCFATGMVASSSAFEGLSSVVQLVYQFLLWSVSRVPVIFEHARLVFVSFKRDSSARLCFGRFD